MLVCDTELQTGKIDVFHVSLSAFYLVCTWTTQKRESKRKTKEQTFKNVIEHLTESAKDVCENHEISDGGDGGSDDGGSGRF